jgi:hypothetical protein
MANYSAEAQRNRRAAQQRIRRRCTCGRIIGGNVGWWSHTHTPTGDKREGHAYDGRA